MNGLYKVVYAVLWGLAKVLYPWETIGKAKLPEDSGIVICANHTSFLDPILLMLAATKKHHIHVMAKAELFKIPILSAILRGIGTIPVKRGLYDISAIKDGLRVLKNKLPLLIFPEGTRVREGESAEAHTGAIVLAGRACVPVLPVYIEARKRLFRKTKVIFGEPYKLQFAGRKPTHEESQVLLDELMERIRVLGETK